MLNETQTPTILPEKIKQLNINKSKLSLHDEKPSLGTPTLGVPAEWFYKTHQFLAKTGILHPHIQTLPI